jgi:hypothetical protein
MFSYLNKLFNAAYYVAKHEKPTKDSENLSQLLNKSDVMLALTSAKLKCSAGVHITHCCSKYQQHYIHPHGCVI